MKKQTKSMRVSTHAHIQTPSHEVCHTTTSCHLKGVARSISKYSANNANPAVCHTERSEVSKNASVNTQNHLDISVSTKPQYDNVGIYAKPQYDKSFVITKETSASPCFASKSKDLRGNPINPPSLAGGDSTYSPSLAEGVRGWVDTTSAIQAKSATANAKNTHPQTPLVLREGAFVLPTRKVANTLTLRKGTSAHTQYDNTHASDKSHRKLALSLATASIIATASLDTLAAGDCVVLQHSAAVGSTNKRVECTGSFGASEFQSKLETAGKAANSGLFYIGTSGGGTSIGAGSVTINLASVGTAQYDYSFQFYGLNAPNTTFTFSGDHNGKPLGILMPYSEAGGSHGANGSTLFGLVLDTNVDYASYGVANVYGRALGLSIHGGTQIGRVDERSGEYQGGLTINAGKTVNAMAIYGGFAGTDRSTFVSKITNNGTITDLNLGWKEYAEDFASVLGLYNISGTGTITTLNVYQATLTINSNPSTWNQHTHSTNLYPEHISAQSIGTVGEVGAGAIRINIGEGVTDANNTYLYEKLIIDSTGGKEIGTGGNKHKPNFSHLSAGLGTALHDMGNGFRVSPDIATSYGASLWRIITMSYMRRAVMTQNALDSLMKKNFRSDLSKYAQKDKEVFLNRARNQRDVDNPARLNRYSPAMRKAMKQNKSTKRKSRTDKAFLDYGGNKNHIAFVLPYAAHSYAELGIASAIEWAGGMIGGVQRQLGDGILGGYLGYEYAYVDAELLRSQAIVHNNSLNIGATYFQSFAFETKPQEAYIKLNARAGLDMPIFEAQSPLPNIKFKLETNTPNSAIPLIWSAGASLRSGINFYQLKYNSYIAPELGVSYDVLSPLDMKLQKAKYKLGGNEYYPMQMWHLPQVSASVKYYKVWGKRFKMSAIGGLRYNVLNKPTGEFKIGGLSGTGTIALPILYGNVDLDLIWTLKQNHELSAGYNGLFYSNFNEFGNASENDRFHGVSTAFNMKYVYWFGGKS